MMRSIPVPVVGAPQPWPPPPSLSNSTDNNKSPACTPGICSFTCPQFCGYLLQQPPPPFFLVDPSQLDGESSSSSSRISPLMASLIAVLAAAFLLLLYYTVVSRFCRLRHNRHRRTSHILNTSDEDGLPEVRLDPMVHDPARPAGLDDSFIRQITVFKYRRADGLIEGTECAVCLNDFNEDENLRLMPNCEHAFHIPCIDNWLKSHSSCPMCRATMDPLPARPGPSPNAEAMGVTVAAMAMQVQTSNDVVLVVREVEGGDGEVVVVCHEEDHQESQSQSDSDSEAEMTKGGVNQRC